MESELPIELQMMKARHQAMLRDSAVMAERQVQQRAAFLAGESIAQFAEERLNDARQQYNRTDEQPGHTTEHQADE